MDVSMMSHMKELEAENRRLKKMYFEEKLKAEIVAKALEKTSGSLSDRSSLYFLICFTNDGVFGIGGRATGEVVLLAADFSTPDDSGGVVLTGS